MGEAFPGSSSDFGVELPAFGRPVRLGGGGNAGDALMRAVRPVRSLSRELSPG